MAVAVVQATSGIEAIGVTSLSATFVSSTTAGNTFVACAAVFDSDGVAPTPFTTTDSKSNTYTKARNQAFGADAGNDGCQLQQDYNAGGTAGASHQITVTPGDTVNMTLGILELSGVDTANPIATNGTGGGIGNSTSPSSGAVTPTQAGLGVAQMGYDAGAKTISPNWTGANQELEIDENNDAQAQSILSKQFSASGADTAAWTLSGAARWGAQLVVYRAGSSTQSFSYTAAGGLSLAGAAAQTRARVTAAAGGIVLAGASSVSFVGAQQFSYTAQGGLSLGGAAAEARTAARVTSGGLSLGGAATMSSHEQQRVVTPSGGILLRGAAAVQSQSAGGVNTAEYVQRRRRR